MIVSSDETKGIRVKKRKVWVASVERSPRMFTGRIEMTFLHEPTVEDVLTALADGDELPTEVHERIIGSHYRVREAWAWER